MLVVASKRLGGDFSGNRVFYPSPSHYFTLPSRQRFRFRSLLALDTFRKIIDDLPGIIRKTTGRLAPEEIRKPANIYCLFQDQPFSAATIVGPLHRQLSSLQCYTEGSQNKAFLTTTDVSLR